MAPRLPLLIALPLLVASCLGEGPPPAGQQLFHGQHLASPSFMKLGEEWFVRFTDRVEPSTTTRGGINDLWMTSFDGTRPRKLVANASDYWGESSFGPGDRYFMVDETLVPTNGGMARTATLLRVDSNFDEISRTPGIWAYTHFSAPLRAVVADPQPGQSCPGFPELYDGCPQLLYERPAVPGQPYPILCLWDGEREIPIGADSGSFQLQPMGSGNIYFIFEAERTLVRLLRPQNVLERIRSGVSRFMLSGDEHWVALAVSEDGRPKTVILDLRTGNEQTPPDPNPAGWNGFGDRTFHYSQNATATEPAKLHVFDLETGEDTFDSLPAPLVNWGGQYNRYQTDERLLVDSAWRGVFTGKGDYVARRQALSGPLLTPDFSPDGKYLVYVSPAAATLYDPSPQGPLLFQDAELQGPPSMVSPPGLLVETRRQNFFFTEVDEGWLLVFWAHLGRSSSDLYFADYDGKGLPTNLRLMAHAILNVSISPRGLFGVVNMSQQDGVGDLVLMDFEKGTRILYAQAVSEATEKGPPELPDHYVAYIVRGRSETDRSGLWLMTVVPPSSDGSDD